MCPLFRVERVLEYLMTFFHFALCPPGSKETPTASTIDSYMSKLQTAISSEPKKHPGLVEKVSSIAKHLEKVFRERLSQDALSGTVLEGEGEGEGDDILEPHGEEGVEGIVMEEAMVT